MRAKVETARTRGRLVTTLVVCACALAGVPAVLGAHHLESGASSSRGPASLVQDRRLKLDLIDRLKSSPETLILGSSRAKRAEPVFLQALTGRTGFNAGVTGGTAADAWVMTRYVTDCFPRHRRRYLWFVDIGLATNGVPPGLTADSRSHKYLAETGAARVSRRACGPGDRRTSTLYNPDGSYTQRAIGGIPKHGWKFDQKLAEAVAKVRASDGRLGLRTDPRRLVWLEKALAFMNRQGVRPVIVLNPVHPAILAELRKYGYPARKAAKASLRQLHERFDFVFVDAEDIRRWGGSPEDFWDPKHINYANTRRLLRYVATHSDGALR
jgi:hypothetical protein